MSDSYSCAVTGYEDFPSPTVYAPKLPSVSVSPSGEIIEGSSVNLTCSSDANPAANYTWYKENEDSHLQPLSKEPQLAFSSIQSSDSGEYYCTAENQLGKSTSKYIFIDVKYAPKLSSVSVNPSGEIVEGSSVTLNCSSDANPAAKYTWYKDNQTLFHGSEGVYNFTSISSEERAMYYCISENQYGQINSLSLFIDVLYGPKLPSVSLSPSGEITEGSSVTLTCSSDANPAANYTWYKKNVNPDLQPLSKEPQLVFSSIQSSDSGEYYCTAESRMGNRTSEYIPINVKYAPKLPSVSASPSAEIVEGSSVTLTCSSDANPAANYTWYKENEDSPKASGQIFTITDVRPEHGGNYYCVAQNRRGSHNSTLHLTVVKDGPKLPSVTLDSRLEYENVSDLQVVTAAQTEDTEEQEDLECEIDKRIGVNINTDEGVVVDRYMKKELNLRANSQKHDSFNLCETLMDDPPDTAEPELVAACAVNPAFDSVKDNLSVASKLDDLTLCNLYVSAKAPWQPVLPTPPAAALPLIPGSSSLCTAFPFWTLPHPPSLEPSP
ncbi:B-cell receptor CD22-like [Scomber japonicus]|uniref:B-cell receptor CD22-like n=1 Tax=Scomber japonicus TaxID=13676 RepID=UPI0023067DF3|nr:B-cell receptor CD22-like [Scomber japonicus]